MKCPHCGQSLGGVTCPACGSEVLPESMYCHRCGVKMPEAVPLSAGSDKGDDDFSKRILCSDGTCIGVVNEKGFCKVCGKRYEGEIA